MAKLVSKLSSLFISKPTRLANTPEGYLNLANKCMERVQKMTLPSGSTLKFNHGQCIYLANKLNMAVESAYNILEAVNQQLNREQVLPQEEMVDCLEIFKRLYALAMEVENIIQSCCRDAWILAAVTLADVSDHISSIGFNLELWSVAFYERNTKVIVDLIFETEVEVVKGHASTDKETLLRDIHALLQRRKFSGAEYERASLLLERLERSKIMQTGDSARSSQSSFSENVMRSLKQMESLGKGSASTVYKALWLGAEFAKKTFYGPNFPDFEKEVSIITGLSHPNITPLICYAKDKRECSIVMELMDEDLFSLMQRRLKVDKARDSPFGILEAVDIMHQLGEGMNYLHEMKIVHRDLKSMNVLVKCVKTSKSEVEYVQVKVADFGMSRTKERSMTYSNQTMNVGTTRWMAPEIIRCLDSASRVDCNALDFVQYPFKCDVYSFGMVCHEILSGDIPFSDIHSSSEVKKMVLNGAHPKLPIKCPELLKNLIERCWSLNPSQRPKFGDICGELRHLKCLLLSMPSAMSDITPPPLSILLGGRDNAPIFSRIRLGNWLVGRVSGSKTRSARAYPFKGIVDATSNFNHEIGAGARAYPFKGIVDATSNFDHEIVTGARAFPFQGIVDTTSNFNHRIGQGARTVSFQGIVDATSNFNHRIGQGGFGSVYYGKLPDGQEIAVKVLDETSVQGSSEFMNEVEVLSRVHHMHLMAMVGYCDAGESPMLVYEFAHNGTLRDHLSGIKSSGPDKLDWKMRVSIALNAAQGLEYLHTGCNPSIIHGDVKSSNVLLTTRLVAKIAGFGLSRFVAEHEDQVMMAVCGTAGYIDPEYYETSIISYKSDVYSFGVVLLELITGRLPYDYRPSGQNPKLCDWVRDALEAGDIDVILDPAVRASNPSVDSLWKVAKTAMRSIEPKSVHRPTMTEVVLELRETLHLVSTSGPNSSKYSDYSSYLQQHMPVTMPEAR